MASRPLTASAQIWPFKRVALRALAYGTSEFAHQPKLRFVPEPTQLLVKPFDPTVKTGIIKAIEIADLGLNPMADGNVIRITVPAPSAERRQQLVAQVKKMAEDTKVALRNERRDANKQIDALVKDKSQQVSEDQGRDAKAEVDELTRKHTESVDALCAKKSSEVEEI